jgi:hypothetical protein
LEPKEGKEAKGGAHSSRRLLLIALGAFGVWSWGLLHEEDIEEELALFVGSKEQLPYIICRRDFILEEGACHLLTVSFLEKFLAIRIQRYQLQSDHSSRTAIPVEGILFLTSQLSSGADLAVSEGAHHLFLLLAVWT